MSNQSESRDPKGRSYEQVTKDGTGSAASVGTGGTGDIGRMSGASGAGNSQSDTRTDDLMSSDSDQEQRQGFRPSDPGAMKTGMEGIEKLRGNRQ
jgi:hypothetical protein